MWKPLFSINRYLKISDALLLIQWHNLIAAFIQGVDRLESGQLWFQINSSINALDFKLLFMSLSLFPNFWNIRI